MTQEEFNLMLQTAIAQGLPGGYYTSKYSGEEIDEMLFNGGANTELMETVNQLQKAMDTKAPLESPAFTGTPTVNGVEIGTGGGSSVSGVNLLDNWYFPASSVIDQRGGYVEVSGEWVRGYTGEGYGIDRWRNHSPDMMMLIEQDGLRVISSEITISEWHPLSQPYLLKEARFRRGDRVTLSALVTVLSSASGEFRLQIDNDTQADYTCSGIFTADVGQKQLYTATFTIPETWEDEDFIRITAYAAPGYEYKMYAMKLELGDTQTLARQDTDGNWVLNDPPPNIQQELAKCQRYQLVLPKQDTSWTGVGVGFAYETTAAQIAFQTPVSMRTSPVVTASGKWELCGGGGVIEFEASNVGWYTEPSQFSDNAAMVNITNFSGANLNYVYVLRNRDDTTAKIILDANL